jgi:hypothetical protein
MKRGVLAVLFLFALFPLAAQADLELHGSVETLHALPFSRDLGLTDSRAAFTGEVSAYAGQASAFVSLSAEYNGASPGRSGFSLGEAWLDWGAGDFSLRLGRQLLSWGAADGLILTDVVCPRNLTAYAGLDFVKSRVPVDGLSLRLGFGGFSAEALWLPVFTPAKLPLERTNPLNAVMFPAALSPIGEDDIEAAKPKAITGGEYGLRLSCYSSLFDLSLCAFYGWNDIPYLSGFAAGPPPYSLNPEFHRMIMAGGDASVPVGDLLFRLEAAYTWGGRFTPDAAITAASGDLTPLERERLQMLAGLDWNPGSWGITAQYYEDILPLRAGGTERDWRENGATLSVSRSFLRETLSVSASGSLGLKDFDAAISADVQWAVTDELEFSLGTDFFTGGIDGRGDYAAYTDLSCLWLRGIYRF